MNRKHTLLTFALTFAFYLLPFAFTLAQPCIPNTSSLDFNGSTSFVRVNGTADLEITGAVTVEAWINPKVFASTPPHGSIFCKHSWSALMYGYVLRAGGAGILSFNIAGAVAGSPVGWREATSVSGALTLNTWYHVAGTFDGTTVKCYVNGSLAGSTAFTGEIYPSLGFKPRIGGLCDTTWGQPRVWNGMIDEVRVWNRALTEVEIQTGMNDHLNPALQTGLVGYWRLNENTGNTTLDLGSGGNNGSLVGATWSQQVPFNNNSLPLPVLTYSAPNLVSSYTTGNQWYFGTNLIPGATQQTYPPTQYGYYKVVVTDTNGCQGISLPFNFNTTDVPENSHDLITLSPNPARNHITITLPGLQNEGALEILSLTGAMQSRYPLTEKINNLDISNVVNGVYFLRVHSNDRSQTLKLIIH